MRVSNWNPQKYDKEFAEASMARLRKAANVIADATRKKLKRQKYGIGKISRPVYRRGPYKGEPWTAREPGALLKTIRVVEKHDTEGALMVDMFGKNRNIRVYAGTKDVYYAKIVEYYAPYLRPALNASKNQIRSILENG